VVLGVALFRAVRLWRTRRSGAFPWFAAALLLWLAWAFIRVVEDSS
jgi:hypothetical protein